MKRFLLVIGLFITSYSWAQENLVPNPSFEDYIQCPVSEGQIYYLKNWFSAVFSPDFFHSCGDFDWGIPNNVFGSAAPYSGNSYVGLQLWDKDFLYREIIGIKLSDSLKENVEYYFECYVQNADSLGYSVKNFGALFRSDTLPTLSQLLQQDYLIQQNPQVKYSDTEYIQDKENWTKISGNFIANGGEKYLFIGNFDTDEETDTLFVGGGVLYPEFLTRSYIYIDDVSLIEDTTTSINEVNQQILYSNVFYANNGLQIEYETKLQEKVQFELLDITGRLVFKTILPGGKNKTALTLPGTEQGIYFYNLSQNNSYRSGKLVIIP